jgi:uncharacterized protein
LKEQEIEEKIAHLSQIIKAHKSAVVAFSGGVDSSVVAAIAFKVLKDKALAVTIDSPLLSQWEIEEARAIADRIGIEHRVMELNELDFQGFSQNPENRCYICKGGRYQALKQLLEDEEYDVILEGTNTSDLGQYRPGLQASREMGIKAPLIEVGLSKEETREIARYLGLPNAKRPSNSCLASRIPYHQEITLERLKRIAQAEEYIRDITNVIRLRVRDHGELARIEVGGNERRILHDEEVMDKISNKLKELGYNFVTLDLQGYRFGSYDQELIKN